VNGFYSFWSKVFNSVNPIFAAVSAAVTFLIFPDQCFVMWNIVIWTVTAIDLLTKIFSIFIKCIRKEKSIFKGVYMAFKTREFNSDTFFHKTVVKIVSYLTIQILVGLSMRISLIGVVNMAVAIIIYNFIFWREFASNIENLIDAGAEYLRTLLFWIKKRESDVFNEKEGD